MEESTDGSSSITKTVNFLRELFMAMKLPDIWAGINGRFINDQSFEPSSIAPLLGLKKDKFYVGYAFQWNIGDASDFNTSGTHLITLGFDFERGRGGTSWR